MGQARQYGLAPSSSRSALVSPRQPEPEEVFLAWLMWLPAGADRRQAAAREIERIDERAIRGEGPMKLRALFVDLAG